MEATDSPIGARCRCGRLIESDADVGVIDFDSRPVFEQGSLEPVTWVTVRREVRCLDCAPPSMAEIVGE